MSDLTDNLPVAASTGITDYLFALFALLLAAKIGEEVFRRIRQPVVAGEILAGLIVGPAVLGIVELNEVTEVFAELGVVFLLFWVGLETRLSDITAVGRSSTQVAVLGAALPVAAGFAIGAARGDPTATNVFLGAALAATSVGITSAILLELKQVDTRAGRTILGAAVIDDVLALLLLAVATSLAATGEIDVDSLLLSVGLAVLFVTFIALGGTRLLRSRPQILEAPRFAESPLLPSVILCLGLAVLSAEIGLAAVIGAFLAGMMVAETKEQNAIETEVAPLYAFFAPFFFASIGAQVDLDQFTNPDVLWLGAVVTVVAIVTKFAGAWLGALGLGRRDAVVVGVGAIPRGEVGVIVAGIGLAQGVIDAELFAIVVGMSLITTLVAPPLLKSALDRRPVGDG
jgi:Kef-type K+ transport system membrane component KefB